jgi:hypothetical protein
MHIDGWSDAAETAHGTPRIVMNIAGIGAAAPSVMIATLVLVAAVRPRQFNGNQEGSSRHGRSRPQPELPPQR